LAASDITGRKVLNRYKIEERLGGGGMSVVWKAYDLVLDRSVALKVLRPEMSDDDEFIARFRREAQSVASLSHPNIVNIYDVGEDGGLYFIIMELVDGRTLRDKLRAEGRLSVQEALRVAQQICQGLSHAHARRIIHRDIKPQNILFTKQGDVKVADFGIARALGGVSTTSRDVVVGSAPYISPEQAKNGTVSDRSDLYSLGIVLYEMLAGKPPFIGDSPVAVALSHVQNEVPSLRETSPEVPQAVDNLVRKALAKNPSDRFASADEMLIAINALIAAGSSTGTAGAKRESAPLPPRRGDDGLARPVKKKRGLSTTAKVFLTLTVVVLALGGYALYQFMQWLSVPTVIVPDVTGKLEVVGQAECKKVGLIQQISAKRPDDTVPAGVIISQSPLGGETVKRGREVYVLISMGRDFATVPDVMGKTSREAGVLFQNAGVQMGDQQEVFHSTVAKGLIVDQNPRAGLDVPRDSLVHIKVSKGPEVQMAIVPDVVGLPLPDAQALIQENTLEVGSVTTQSTPGVAAGIVVSQDPEAGTEQELRTKVNLVISGEPAAFHTEAFRIVVSEGTRQKPVNLRVTVTDATGEKQVYDQNVPKGTYNIAFAWQGDKAVVRWWIGGQLSVKTIYPR
jgi:beta-lactam-binding protein with PASTA domain/tRNA A-37 threonylcarbamoyl transferase component Bud32